MASSGQNAQSTIRFKAKLLGPNAKTKLWTIMFPSSAKLKSQGITMIEGAIDWIPFRAALKQNGKGGQYLQINKALYEAIGAQAHDTVEVEITRVGDEAETRMPADLGKALAKSPLSRESWNDITPLARRDWIFSICTAKQLQTRRRRIEKACDMLASGKRRLCCFPGVKWIMRDYAKPSEMWAALPNSKNRI